MEGTTLSRTVRGLAYLALHPRDAARWTRDRLRPRTPLELALPWVAWPCIDWLERQVLTNLRVFEYGGGGSTLYFLRRGCHVTTVENSPAWAKNIQEQAERSLGSSALERLELRVHDMPEHPGPADQATATGYVDRIGAGTRYDLVLVDGADGALELRMVCLGRARHHLTDKGVIVLDDSWRRAYEVAPRILEGFKRRIFEGVGPARVGVTRTDVYERTHPPPGIADSGR